MKTSIRNKFPTLICLSMGVFFIVFNNFYQMKLSSQANAPTSQQMPPPPPPSPSPSPAGFFILTNRPKPVSSSKLEQIFETRRRQVETYCQSYNWKDRFVGNTRFYNNSITNTIFCMSVLLLKILLKVVFHQTLLFTRPFKCSTSITLAELFKATNIYNVSTPTTYHASNPVVKHEKLPTPEDVLRLINRSSDYTKIMFYRHPMDRLISAWENKVKYLSKFLSNKVRSKFFQFFSYLSL